MAKQLIGVISDTHGLMRPEAIDALRGVELILHAGDIGKPELLEELTKIAPVLAIRGNNDKGEWAKAIPATRVVEAGGISIFMLHDIKDLEKDTVDAKYRVIVSGHSHSPKIEERGGVLFLNPGSAGPRRFKLPIGLAILELSGSTVNARFVKII